MFWAGLIVGLFPGAFLGFLFVAVFSAGRRETIEETAGELSGMGRNPVLILFVSNETEDWNISMSFAGNRKKLDRIEAFRHAPTKIPQ